MIRMSGSLGANVPNAQVTIGRAAIWSIGCVDIIQQPVRI